MGFGSLTIPTRARSASLDIDRAVHMKKAGTFPKRSNEKCGFLRPAHSLRRKRISLDDERLKKSRKVFDHYLRKIGPNIGKELEALNSEGITYFPFERFIVVLEVPTDNPGVCYIYTMVCRLDATANVAAVAKKAMQLNYMQQGTRGGTLGLDGEEVNLCFSSPISALDMVSLQTILEEFMSTASEVNVLLDQAKAL